MNDIDYKDNFRFKQLNCVRVKTLKVVGNLKDWNHVMKKFKEFMKVYEITKLRNEVRNFQHDENIDMINLYGSSEQFFLWPNNKWIYSNIKLLCVYDSSRVLKNNDMNARSYIWTFERK